MQDLTEAYFSIYEDHDDLNEVTGGGHISPEGTSYTGKRSKSQQRYDEFRARYTGNTFGGNPQTARTSVGIRSKHVTGSRNEVPVRSPKGTESNLALPPVKRAELAAKRAEKEGSLEGRKRANEIRRKIEQMKEDYVDEGRAFPGGPDLAHTFPLPKKDQESAKKIGAAAKAKAADIAGASQTKSPSKPPTTKPEQTPTLRRSRGTTNRSGDTWKASNTEQFDFYDLVLDYLLDEGYADTEENAISMMSAMSEDWINSIIG